MEARRLWAASLAALVVVALGSGLSLAAQCRSPNFLVNTSDAQLAQQISQAAEKYRHDLAVAWLGKPMPNWSAPCVMNVRVGPNLGAGGATTFIFDRGEVFGWRMNIQGSVERIFDSVLPHEITHMIFASHFREPLPRWADEGGATSVEHPSEKTKHRQMLVQFLRTGRGIAFNQMFAMRDYPADVMPLYAQGFSLAEYLIQLGGRRKYVEFLGDGLKSGDWHGAVKRHYGTADLAVLQNNWLAWVKQGFPAIGGQESSPVAGPPPEMLAAGQRMPRPEPNLIYHIRGQDPGASGATAAAGSGRATAVPVPVAAAGDSSIYARLAAAYQQQTAAQQAAAAASPSGLAAGTAVPKAQSGPTPMRSNLADALVRVKPAASAALAGGASPMPGLAGPVVLPASGWHAVGQTGGPAVSGGLAGANCGGVCAGGVCAADHCASGLCAGGTCGPMSTRTGGASGPMGTCAGGICGSGGIPRGIAGPVGGQPTHTQLAHPQPIEPARQTVLEWSRTPGTILR